MATKKCFVISPIGDEKTEVRAESDAILWIAQNALAKYSFEVIRVDQIARSTIITNEIIQLIQESELCLMVLTGQNPNVYYEAGRRHETGKPFIQLIKKGEKIPFDVASIRTIIYDNVEARLEAAKTIQEIQKYVDEFEKAGYGASGTGVSLSTLASSIDRIERKIAQIMSGAVAFGSLPAENAEAEMPALNARDVFKDPRELFMDAVTTGNLHQAIAALPRMEKIIAAREFVAAALLLVKARYEPAAEMVLRTLTDRMNELGDTNDLSNEGMVDNAIGGLAAFFNATDREEEGLARLEPIINKIISNPELTVEARASYKNQIQRLLYGMHRYEEALKIAEECIQLNPNEPSFYYNASLICEKLNLLQKSSDMVDKYMGLGDISDAALIQAVEIYARIGRINEAKKIFTTLKAKSPAKAFAVDNDVLSIIGMKT